MARQKYLTPEDIRRIIEAALWLMDNYGDNAVTTTEVIERVVKRGGRRFGRSTVDRILAKGRKDGVLRPKVGSPQLEIHSDIQSPSPEGPWSVGALSHYDIPDEAIETLILVRRWCLAAGLSLTCRQAKWAARLRCFFGCRRIADLYRRSAQYAIRERASEAVGQRCDTQDLDDNLLESGYWENATRIELGFREITFSTDEDFVGQPIDPLALFPSWVVRQQLGLFWKSKEMLSGWWDLRALPTDQAERVFSYYLRYLSQGPKWDSLNQEDKVRIMKCLHEHVEKLAPAAEDYEKEHPGPMIWDPEPRPPYENWVPGDLLKEVGYDD